MTISGEIGAAHWESLRLLLPGRAVGLYLVGSAAHGDVATTSNVDTVTVLEGPLDRGDQQLLRGVHADIESASPGIHYDTIYIPRSWLAAPPSEPAPMTPFSRGGRLRIGERSDAVNPLAWLVLARGERLAGAALGDLEMRVDPVGARMYANNRLHRYWAAIGAELALAGTWRRPHQGLAEPAAVVWTVLGVPRLAVFVATGRLVSKSEAGALVLERFSEYADLVGRALAQRRGEKAAFTHGDLATTAALVRQVLAAVDTGNLIRRPVAEQVTSAVKGSDPAITGEPPEERASGLLALH